MIIMRESGYRAVPWKNGGGTTREILRVPPEPTAFDWRLSLATIDSAGPFSSFAGYQRTLVLVRGPGVELDFGQHGRVQLALPGQMVSFDGAWETHCTLLDGPSTDLNLIVSQERARSASRCVQLAQAELVQTADWPETLVCCISGEVRLTNMAGEVSDLSTADVARCSPSDGTITCTPTACTPTASTPRGTPPARLFVAGLGPSQAKAGQPALEPCHTDAIFNTPTRCEPSMNGYPAHVIGIYSALLMAAAPLLATPAMAADAAAGRTLFRQQCTVCHTAEPNDGGGAQGPALIGVYGRHAASDPSFGYTKALQDSKLTWDAQTLDRFLASPTKVVPGTAMVVSVDDNAKRADLVEYFKSVQATAANVPPASAPQGPAPSASEADWKKDAPGRAHKIDLANLPAPFSTESARNSPKLIPRPAYAEPKVPPGFHIAQFAADLLGPRRMIVAPNGDIFVTEMRGGRVSVLHPAPDGRSSAAADVFAEGLNRPFGIAFYPTANPTWLYVAETNRVVRFAFKNGDVKARSAPEVVVPELPSGGGHSTRDIVFSPDGRRMFISVGSASNYAEQMPKKTVAQAKAWEAKHALGATWGTEKDRADVLVFRVGSKRPGKVFATGIRNCVGLTLQPKTDDLWCTTNERDALGDDLVPDYSTRVKEGGFYGWPWYYMGSNEEPRLKGDRPDLKDKVLVPDVPYQAHSAALGLVFYTATSGKSAFPAQYIGDGFALFHGSWNRGFRTGHKVVRVRMKDGVPTGEYEDFVTGFIVDDGDAWGRPVAGVVLNDGSLLFSDDGADVIYRVSYEK